jgi:hypothetical protein
MKGNGMFAILFVCSIALCITTGYAYLKLENKDFSKASAAVDDVRINMSAIEAEQNKFTQSQQTFFANTVTALEELNKRIETIENKKPEAQNVNLKFTDPLKISVVYRQAVKKIPTIPKVVSGRVKQVPLIERAGLLDQ